MRRATISDKTRLKLWVTAGGRCEYAGCNKPLLSDLLTYKDLNAADVAHILAVSPGGPRFDAERSSEGTKDLANLMLLCQDHHRLIDEDVDGHPADTLLEMKRSHEQRIELLTSIHPNRKSHVVLYGANIGRHNACITWNQAAQAMIPDYYPAEKLGIELGLKNSVFPDHEAWDLEKRQLQRQFQQKLKPVLASNTTNHFSIFALAPQPLLIELGRLLSDIPAAEVYQLHREPPGWKWREHKEDIKYTIEPPDTAHPKVALNLSLSATIDNARISAVLNGDFSIWTLTVPDPNNDLMESREQLSAFRKCFRRLLNQIKAKHGEQATIYLFPAVPVAVAVEIGRVWMHKADLPMRIYDQNRETGGFTVAFDIETNDRVEVKCGN